MPGPVLSKRRRRIQRWVRRSFLVRFHMGLILVAVVLSGLVASRLLLELGLAHMGLRYAAAVLFGYGVFFGCVRLWLLYVERTGPAEGLGDLIDLADAAPIDPDPELVDAAVGLGGESLDGDAGGGGGFAGGFDLDLGDGDGLVVLVVLAVVLLVFFGVAFYLIYQAPVILSDAAGQLLLAAALRKRAKRIEAGDWSGRVLRATWLPAFIALVVTAMAGFILQSFCPEATKVAEVVDRCVGEE